MMHWQDNIDEKKQQQWQSRVTRERLDLSASVEEALIDESAQEVLELEEFDDFVPDVEKAMLIPPCLSIQSKQLPAVRTLPKARTDHLPIATKEGVVFPKTEFPRTVPNKRRSPLHTTKVHLQVVPKPQAIARAASVDVSRSKTATNPGLPAVESFEGRFASPLREGSAATTGSANFERDQSEVMVANAHITATSVVVVVLTADPGPVVVQYVSLQPAVGFTVHLSAPAKNPTTFNYRIC